MLPGLEGDVVDLVIKYVSFACLILQQWFQHLHVYYKFPIVYVVVSQGFRYQNTLTR